MKRIAWALAAVHSLPIQAPHSVERALARLSTERAVREQYSQALERKRAYDPELAPIFRAMGVPEELLVVPVVESAYRNFPAHASAGGSAGLWQFQPATARRFGLRVDEKIDERMDPRKSTRAAAEYFQYLRSKFGDWHAAIAAFQIGEGALEAHLNRAPGKSVWDLVKLGKIPDYLPEVMARILLDRGAAYFPRPAFSESGSRNRGVSLGMAVEPLKKGKKPAIFKEPVDLDDAK